MSLNTGYQSLSKYFKFNFFRVKLLDVYLEDFRNWNGKGRGGIFENCKAFGRFWKVEWKRKKRNGIFENCKASERFWKLEWKRKRRSGIFENCKAYLDDFGNWNGKGRGGVKFLRIVRHIWTILESGMGKEEEWNF